MMNGCSILNNVTENSEPNESITKINYRLPKSVQPKLYDIKISTLFDSQTEPFRFDGQVIIYFLVNTKVNSITFQQSELSINVSSIEVKSDGRKINVHSISYDNFTELFTVYVAELLEVSKNYSIFMEYSGTLKMNNYGLYKSFYVNSNGTKK